MTDNTESLILEHLEAIRASQERMEEMLRSIELRWASLEEDNGEPPVLLQPDHKKPFTHKGYQVRPGRHVRSKDRVEVYRRGEGEEPEYEDVITVVDTPGEARKFIDAMVASDKAKRRADREFQEKMRQLEEEAEYDSFQFGTDSSGGLLGDDEAESNPIVFKPFTERGHHVRPGRHVRSRGRVEVYEGTKSKRLGTDDTIHVVDTPRDARKLIHAMVIHREESWGGSDELNEVLDDIYPDWFRFGTDESGGLLVGDDEWVGDGTHPPA